MMTPLAMLIIGHEIANMKVLDLIKDGWAYVVSLLRLLVIPTIVCVIFMFLPVDHEVLKVLVFLLAMPCGTLNVILSQQYGTNPQFASRATTQTMILFLITVPSCSSSSIPCCKRAPSSSTAHENEARIGVEL